MSEQGVTVVGVDFEAAGDEAIRTALGRPELSARRQIFVVALDTANLPDEFGEEEFDSEEEVLERAAQLLRKRIENVARMGNYDLDQLRIQVLPRLGKPATVLLSACAEYEAELLIVGTHSRRGLDRFMLGSVAESVVREAPCPVLVARPLVGRTRALNSAYVGER